MKGVNKNQLGKIQCMLLKECTNQHVQAIFIGHLLDVSYTVRQGRVERNRFLLCLQELYRVGGELIML